MNIKGMSPSLAPLPLFGGKKDAGAAKNVLVVGGSGTVERDPDMMTITLSVKADGKDEKKVHGDLKDKATRLFEAVKALAFPAQLQTHQGVNEKHEYDQNTRVNVKKGYEGAYQITVTDKVKKAADLLTHAEEVRKLAEDNGANMHGPAFSLSPTRYRAAQKVADAKAYDDAKKSAQVVAERGNFRLANEPVEVKIGVVSEYRGGARAMSARAAGLESAALGGAADDAGAGSVFEFKPLQVVSKPVQAVFEILSGKAKKEKKAKKA